MYLPLRHLYLVRDPYLTITPHLPKALVVPYFCQQYPSPLFYQILPFLYPSITVTFKTVQTQVRETRTESTHLASGISELLLEFGSDLLIASDYYDKVHPLNFCRFQSVSVSYQGLHCISPATNGQFRI